MRDLRPIRLIATLALALVAGGGLAGCGVKGSLEPPAAAKADPTAKSDSGQGKAEGEAPKPHRDFLLDGLIR
jgi:predicted small lipoprotein YifL